MAGGSGGASGNPRNTTFPFIACGGRGGGGGGALALIGLSIENLRITANGADGSGSGTQNSRRGGSGSGGGICLAAPAVLSNVQAQAIGGGQNAPTGKGGDGRIRCDAPAFNALNSQPSAYQGPTVDTISVATGEFTLQGSGAPGKTILLFAKPSNGVWQLVDSTTVAANARWQYRVRPPANAEYLYLAAAQREQPIPTTRYTARPAAVFSHSSGRRVRILSSPLQVNPATLDMGRISCADGQVRLDSFTIRNPGTLQVSITSASVQNPATGFRIVRPQPVQAILGAGQALTVVVEYRLQPNRYGVQHDTIVVRGISDTVLVRVPVRIVVDSAGIIILAPDSAKSISAIDFAQTCRGIAKERTFIIRLVGTAPTQLIRIATGTSDFTVEQPSKTALAPGDTVFIRLRALPPDTGNYFDTLTIESVLCNQVLHIPLRVQGISSELIGVGDNRNGVVDFGSIRVGRRSTRRIGVFNTSTLDTSIVLFSHQPALPFSWRLFPATTPYPAPIPMRDTLHIDVEFTPTALGIFRDSLVVISQQHGATCPDTVRFILVGQGTLSAIVPSKTLVDFGTIACGFRRDTIWLKNTGNTEATVTFPAVIAGSDAAYFRLVEQPQGDVELRAGDSVRIIIEARIIPQNADGIKTAKLQCTVRDDSVRTLEIPLQLFQQALILEFTPQPYILYDVPINFTSQSQPPLTVRNLSSVEACIADIRLSR
ncbi:MAG: hypothetical protein N2971_02865, partial [Chlorobi bacterium]|nr:hypothetical protein [Chlorobiota bacterium]